MNKEIDDCNLSQISFYDARRKISQAAIQNAHFHKIDLEVMDDSDDEQFDRFSSSIS